MRHTLLILSLSLLHASGVGAANAVSGECQREGTTLKWVDGIAFESARDEAGTLTTAIYFSTLPIDRTQLTKCPDCSGELPVNTFLSTREDWIEAQLREAKGGWFAASHIGGELDMVSVNDVGYMAPDGVQTGIQAGNERLKFDINDGKHMQGTLFNEEGDYFGATCSGTFDLEVGWPAG